MQRSKMLLSSQGKYGKSVVTFILGNVNTSQSFAWGGSRRIVALCKAVSAA